MLTHVWLNTESFRPSAEGAVLVAEIIREAASDDSELEIGQGDSGGPILCNFSSEDQPSRAMVLGLYVAFGRLYFSLPPTSSPWEVLKGSIFGRPARSVTLQQREFRAVSVSGHLDFIREAYRALRPAAKGN